MTAVYERSQFCDEEEHVYCDALPGTSSGSREPQPATNTGKGDNSTKAIRIVVLVLAINSVFILALVGISGYMLLIPNMNVLCHKDKPDQECQTFDFVLNSLTTEVGRLTTEVATLKSALANAETNMTSKPEPAVGFTVNYIKSLSSSSHHATFSTVVSNIGDGYDTATGLFTCSQKGTYYFSASLLRMKSYSGYMQCRIYKNNDALVLVYTNPGHSGYVPAVSSVHVHLKVGDTVKLAGCSSISEMDTSESTLSGFLVTADVD